MQFQYVRHHLGRTDSILERGMVLSAKDTAKLDILRKPYNQQRLMYGNNAHSAPLTESSAAARITNGNSLFWIHEIASEKVRCKMMYY